MREHIYFHGGGTDNRQTENAKVEASLNLRLAESGAKKRTTTDDDLCKNKSKYLAKKLRFFCSTVILHCETNFHLCLLPVLAMTLKELLTTQYGVGTHRNKKHLNRQTTRPKCSSVPFHSAAKRTFRSRRRRRRRDKCTHASHTSLR